MGVSYKSASGQLIPNEGEVDIVHHDPTGNAYNFKFQHAKVHCPILSVTDLIYKGCTVSFHKDGGHISYVDGSRIRFVRKKCVFFVLLNIGSPVFSRQGEP